MALAGSSRLGLALMTIYCEAIHPSPPSEQALQCREQSSGGTGLRNLPRWFVPGHVCRSPEPRERLPLLQRSPRLECVLRHGKPQQPLAIWSLILCVAGALLNASCTEQRTPSVVSITFTKGQAAPAPIAVRRPSVVVLNLCIPERYGASYYPVYSVNDRVLTGTKIPRPEPPRLPGCNGTRAAFRTTDFGGRTTIIAHYLPRLTSGPMSSPTIAEGGGLSGPVPSPIARSQDDFVLVVEVG
jgi:hypothetical protein